MMQAPPLSALIRLREPEAISCEEVKALYEALPKNETPEDMFDKTHSLRSVIERLYRALFFGKEKLDTGSSTGADQVVDQETNDVLFYSKRSRLPEDLGVPNGEAISREHLYYLLDHEGFAGVPPLFRVRLNSDEIRCFSLYKKKCWWCSKPTEEQKVAFRRCIIHQFRTMNMDPSYPNLLMPNESKHVVFPIDGGYCLPEFFSDNRRFFSIIESRPSLAEKPFLDEPFTDEEIAYIDRLDLEKDEVLIDKHLPGNYLAVKVLNIFRVANLILKKAVKGSVSITLHDLCNIRDLRAFHHQPKKSLFADILEGDASLLDARIERVFTEILRIKEAIHKNKKPIEQFTLELLKTIDEKALTMRNIAAYYALGAHGFYKEMDTKGELADQLRKIL